MGDLDRTSESVQTLDDDPLAKTAADEARSGERPQSSAPTPHESLSPEITIIPTSDPGQKPEAALPRIGRYILLRTLGEGGMGVVYAAYDEELDRKAAVKVIHPSKQEDRALRTRIIREAQALARVSAPNVVTVYQAGEADGRLFIAMEFVNGTTLTKWQTEARRSWQDILRMYIAAGQGLLAAHQADLIHRDFKPDNVLIGKDGRPRVADFGLARIENKTTAGGVSAPLPAIMRGDAAKQQLSPVTQAGALLGTPLYMSPEQHLGDKIDSRSDQFSFCVALYEALYGKLPFAGNTLESLAFNTVSGRIQPRPTGTMVPTVVHKALLRGLSPSPAQRFPSMRDLLTELSYDPNIDLSAGPRVRRRVLISMIAFMLIATVGKELLVRLGVGALRASLVIAFAYFAVFVFLALLFRRAFKNAFHRGMMVYGVGFGGQILALRAIGLLLGLSYVQILTLDLVALGAMTGVIAALVLPQIWPVIPLSILGAVGAGLWPQYAQILSSGGTVITTIASLVLWNRAVAMGSHRRRASSTTEAK